MSNTSGSSSATKWKFETRNLKITYPPVDPITRSPDPVDPLLHHLTRNQLLLSSSHTHSGPVVDKMLGLMYPMNSHYFSNNVIYLPSEH